MNITIFGLGYIGSVSAACLSDHGHQVVGVDVNPKKVKSIQSGKSPIGEPGLQERIQRNQQASTLSATQDAAEAVRVR